LLEDLARLDGGAVESAAAPTRQIGDLNLRQGVQVLHRPWAGYADLLEGLADRRHERRLRRLLE